jgi:2-hydroxy-3-keto-5-methylthiopentenyl-1-phosphate phosphatase
LQEEAGIDFSDMMNPVVLCDFDGTITTIDTAELVLARFAQGDFQSFDKQFEKGELTLDEYLNGQFSLVKASKKEILEELKDKVIFRPHFKELAEYCKEKQILFMIVSAGLDFVIEHFLKLNGCQELVETCTPKAVVDAHGISFKFPKLLDPTSDNFKQDIVRNYKGQAKKVIYVGDGFADCAAAMDADCSFAIEGSRLAELCKSLGIPCRTITDFQTIIDVLRKIPPRGYLT